MIEAIYGKVLPSAYADEYISHYTKKELSNLFATQGLSPAIGPLYPARRINPDLSKTRVTG